VGRRRGAITAKRWPLWVAVVLLALFVALAALVETGVTQHWDLQAVHRLRPDDGWGVSQQRWSPWMSRLKPDRMYLLLGVTAVVLAAWRRSLWPVVFAVVLAGVSGVLTVATKLAFQRPDPHGYVSPTGGSYPSGHIVAVLVCLAGCLLLVWPRLRWWMWVPVLGAAALMTVGLLVAAAHWPTDIVGGALLALGVVAALSRLPMRQRAVGSGFATGWGSRRNARRRGATTSAS
jgi:membrane-associated phospholipid phosphatase